MGSTLQGSKHSSYKLITSLKNKEAPLRTRAIHSSFSRAGKPHRKINDEVLELSKLTLVQTIIGHPRDTKMSLRI